MNQNNSEGSILSPEAIEQGLEIRDNDHHITELLKDGQVLARFSTKGVEIDNVLKEIEAGKYRN